MPKLFYCNFIMVTIKDIFAYIYYLTNIVMLILLFWFKVGYCFDLSPITSYEADDFILKISILDHKEIN